MPVMPLLQFIGIVAMILGRSLAVIIVPAPTLSVEEATSETITLAWTMPINEDYDNFTIMVSTTSNIEQVVTINETSVVIQNLVPGVMYDLSATAQRQQLQSDPARVKQDTVPLPPTNLKLSCFDELVLTMEGPFFMETQFTVEVYGIEATWDGPERGISECYDAWIEPNSGPVATSAQDNEADQGSRIRQFLQLIPGTTYTVFVRSSTCGNGFLGRLPSEPIQQNLPLKPANPPPITVEDVTSSSAKLSWKTENFVGIYDDFELILSNGTQTNMFVTTPTDPRTMGRDLSGLTACSEYHLQLFTLYQGLRSKRSQSVTFFTLPSTPMNLHPSKVAETSFQINWNLVTKEELTKTSFQIILFPTNNILFSTEEMIQLTNLSPGTIYFPSVFSVCKQNISLQSERISIEVLTKPSPPVSVDVSCLPQSDEFGFSTGQAMLTLTWTSPKEGSWNGFVVDYSPYQFNTIENYLTVVPNSEPNELSILVPGDGRIFTVYLRTIFGNVLSNATMVKTLCNPQHKQFIHHCRSSMLHWRIVVTIINNGANMLIQIPNYPMYNATIDLGNDFIVTKNYTILIDNPCGNPYPSKIQVHPVCSDGKPCLVITKRLCVVSAKVGASENLCCSERLYNPTKWKCCHSQLQDRSKPNMECCYTRWYDTTYQKCCGQKDGNGIIRASSKSCE